MTRSIASAVLLSVVSSLAAAQERAPRVEVRMNDGQVIRSAVSAPAADGRVDVIVQFRDVPLFAREPFRIATNSVAARREAEESFTQRFAAFERDLATIDRGLRGRGVTSNATGEASSVITERYSRVFAGAAVNVPAEAVAQLEQLDYVRGVHRDRTLRATLEHSVPKIRAPEVWSLFGTRGANVVVAIIDTGVDYTHPALGGGFGPGKRVVGGYDFVNKDGDPMDDAGHGTHVAGIVGGNGGGIVGVAPEVTFLAYKVLNANGAGSESKIIAGVERAADPNQDGSPADHADVANLSLGGPGNLDAPLTVAIETASATGIIFCIAAGNDGAFQRIGSPANAPSAITVGAADTDDVLAAFSSKGPVVESLAVKPEVVAPGVDIVSSVPGGQTDALSGTSMASPHVAGVAALLRSIHRDWPVAHIKAAIVGTAEALGNEAMAEGGGRVDALRAATTDIVVLQSVVSFGSVSTSHAHWTASATLTLVNHGSAARTLALETPSPRVGISIGADVTSIELAPGASRDVHLALDVDNALVPVPEATAGSLAYSGAIRISGGAVPLHVTWAFVDGAPVTLDYDGTGTYEALLFGAGASTVAHIPETRGRASVLVPNGTYDVQVFADTFAAEQFIIVEQQVVDGAKTVPVHRAGAIHSIALAAEDERGRSLVTDRICQQYLAIMGPSQTANGVTIVSSDGDFVGSTVSDRYTFVPMVQCADASPKKAYAGQFTSLAGLAASHTLAIRASDWSPTPVRIKVPDGAVKPKAAILTGWLWNGEYSAASVGSGRSEAVTTPIWDGTLYLTRSRHPLMSAAGTATLNGDITAGPFTLLSSPQMRRTDEGIIAWPYRTNTPVTYVAAEGEPLLFGDGLLHLQPILTRSGFIVVMRPRFRGALDEDRFAEAVGSTAVLRNSAGAVTGNTGQATLRGYFVDPDRYDYEVTKPISLRGIAGTATLHARFDAALPDFAPPSLTSLRLLDPAGRNRSLLLRGEGGTLQLSAMDFIPKGDQGDLTFAAIRTDSLAVQWRPHGTTAWTPLPATLLTTEIANGLAETTALGHPSLGSTYRADLLTLSQSTADAIDLTFRCEDASGNSYEWTLAPALTIEAPTHRRATRH